MSLRILRKGRRMSISGGWHGVTVNVVEDAKDHPFLLTRSEVEELRDLLAAWLAVDPAGKVEA